MIYHNMITIQPGTRKNNNIDAGDKWKVNESVTILKLLKEKYLLTILHMVSKTISHAETDMIFPQFHVGYMSM